MVEKLTRKFARKTIKEIAQQIADMPDEPVKEDNMEEEKKQKTNNNEDFISKREMLFLLGGFLAGYLVFHNSIKISRTGRF